MSSYLWWAANQAARISSTWVASHPAEASLIGVGLANAATRGFTWDVLKSVAWRTSQMTGRIALDIGKSAIKRSTLAGGVWSYTKRVAQYLSRHPVATVVALDIAAATTAIALAKDEDPRTESIQMRSTSHGLSGTGAGGGISQPSIGTGGSWLIGGGTF